ncbi:MAG: hypothetical protein AAB818_03185 [Patescibacteria group bacterium]
MTISWTAKKQLTYFLVFFIAGMFVIAFFVLKIVAPTCFDSKQNQDEKGVDCGGVCSQECLGVIKDLTVLWSKPLKISESRYDAVALVENRNLFLSAKSVKYQFKFYDDRNILIATRDGEVFVNPGQKFAIFENNIDAGARKPAKVFLEFQKDIKWGIHKEENLGFVITNKEYKNSPRPAISAILENKTLANIKGVYAVAIIYADNGNAIAASATKIKEIKKESSMGLFFTWPESFDGEYFRDEIYLSAQSVSSL